MPADPQPPAADDLVERLDCSVEAARAAIRKIDRGEVE